jgi:ATP-dependent RNA helicase DeaD
MILGAMAASLSARRPTGDDMSDLADDAVPPTLSVAPEAPSVPPPAAGNDVFDETKTFADLGLRDSVLQGVTDAGFVHPTDIQARLIPPALAGKDLIGQAKTGTGKTAAFALPILHHADKDVPMQALVLVPTRELASQVTGEIEELGKHTPIRSTCIIGGESMRQQARSVQRGGHILVGTPGRIMDMHSRGEIRFDRIRFVVLDEVDRMLDIGFREDIRRILGDIRQDHQTIFVSATISPDIERLARSYMKSDAVKIHTAAGALTVSLVDQKHLPVEPWDKQQLLLHLLRHEKPDTTLVFCRTKATVHRVTHYLRDKGVSVREIHGDLPQNKRNKVMASLREGQLDVLVASDLAARGLDVEHISHVINYDLPDDPEVYVHRIGRTARAGRKGIAWSFVTPEQGQLLTEIEKLTGVLIEKLDYPDFTPGRVPEDVRVQRERDAVVRSKRTTVADRAAPVSVPDGVASLSQGQIKAMFPDGKIPQNLPKRGLAGKFRTKRRR